MIYLAAGVSGLTNIVGLFFVKELFPAAFLVYGFGPVCHGIKMPLGILI